MLKFNNLYHYLINLLVNLNTSYVKVQLKPYEVNLHAFFDLNTSYVKVQFRYIYNPSHPKANLNTSYVKVQYSARIGSSGNSAI